MNSNNVKEDGLAALYSLPRRLNEGNVEIVKNPAIRLKCEWNTFRVQFKSSVVNFEQVQYNASGFIDRLSDLFRCRLIWKSKCFTHFERFPKLALISPTSGGRWVGIVRWRTKAPEFVVCLNDFLYGTSVHRNASTLNKQQKNRP
jgi:hypothetical protein